MPLYRHAVACPLVLIYIMRATGHRAPTECKKT